MTDDESRRNWEKYGNPDGPGAMSFGIALPSWIVEKENSVWVNNYLIYLCYIINILLNNSLVLISYHWQIKKKSLYSYLIYLIIYNLIQYNN